MVIQKGSQVSLDYTLTIDGKIVDSTKGRQPYQYTHGEGRIFPEFSKQLEGLKVGDEKKIELSPEQAYGPVNPKAFQEVSRAQLPPDIEPKVGMQLQVENLQGRSMIVRVAELKKDTIVIDFNHPLAGKTLVFQVKIVSIK